MSTPTRADFADALNGAGLDLAASEFPSEPFGPGSAWAQPGAWTNPGGLPNGVFECTWEIYIVVPQDSRAASVWWDTHAAAAAGAVMHLVFIDSIEPISLPTDGGDLWAVLITGRSE